MKLSRRGLAKMAGGSAVAAAAMAQMAPATGAEADLAQARDNNKRLWDALSKVELPLATEPAFQFKA